MGYVFLAFALVFNACANVLIKMGSIQFALWQDNFVRATVGNWAFVAGLVLFALNVVLYALALSRIPLSVGYPIMTAGGIMIITLVSALYMRETVSLYQGLGLLMLMGGLILVVQR